MQIIAENTGRFRHRSINKLRAASKCSFNPPKEKKQKNTEAEVLLQGKDITLTHAPTHAQICFSKVLLQADLHVHTSQSAAKRS
ncbi:hypothetical protein A7M48_22505 [Acinetobacter baumannii]|nr:hypothetical protein A7M48_22505 [Acinetobacter baumannii]